MRNQFRCIILIILVSRDLTVAVLIWIIASPDQNIGRGLILVREIHYGLELCSAVLCYTYQNTVTT